MGLRSFGFVGLCFVIGLFGFVGFEWVWWFEVLVGWVYG